MSIKSAHPSINWKTIDTVLLDLDGTLLDLHFDNYFWRHHVPQRYAEKHDLSIETSREELYRRYGSVRGTLQWYCVEYWTEELGLDIALLKKEVEHLIAVHPHVVEFLEAVRQVEKRTVLVTNAHGKSLELKLSRTQLGEHFDVVVCAHDLGVPKEEVSFWDELKKVVSFRPGRTLLIDDSPEVLRSAKGYGIKHILAVAKPDTRGPERIQSQFDTLADFAHLIRSLELQLREKEEK